jgi:poly(A) polymerase
MDAQLLAHLPLKVLQTLYPDFPETGQLCLVGGAVRDALLDRPVSDFDFTSPGDPSSLASALAAQLGGHWFWLDKPRWQSRVVADSLTCDFAPWRAATLTGDLAARDFTINAMALDIAAPAALFDPLGGRGDLAQGKLRMAGPGVLHDDPLRILKGIRHAVELDLQVEPSTLAAMCAATPHLAQVAAERLRLEVWRILAAPGGSRGLELLDATGAGSLLFGSGFTRALPACMTSHRRTQLLFATLAASSLPLAALLTVTVEQGLDRQTLLLWHDCLRQVDPRLPLALGQDWRFSRLAMRRLAALSSITPDYWDELLVLPRRPRPLALWAQQRGRDPFDLLLAMALQQADPSTCATRLTEWLELLGEVDNLQALPCLVDGEWLRDTLGLDGPAIGAVLAALCQAEICGKVVTVADARRLAQQLADAKMVDNP